MEMVRMLSSRLMTMEETSAEALEEKQKLLELEKGIKLAQQVLATTEPEQKEGLTASFYGTGEARTSQKHLPHTPEKPITEKTNWLKPTDDPDRKHQAKPRKSTAPAPQVKTEDVKHDSSQDEIRYLRSRVSSLENANDVLTAKNSLLEREVKRLEHQLHREQELNLAKREEVLMERERRINELEIVLLAGHGPAPTPNGNELHLVREVPKGDHVEVSAEGRQEIEGMNSTLASLEMKLKDIDSNIGKTTIRIKKKQLDVLEKRAKKSEDWLESLQMQEKKIDHKISTSEEDEFRDSSISMEEEEDGVNSAMSSPGKSPNRNSGPSSPGKFSNLQNSTERFELFLGKLEKLDKLDEVLRKLDSIKAGSVSEGSGRSYTELKVELEALQLIIFDETDKYTAMEKEDANIKYEKVSQELAQTDEYKKEVAAALEEKRKKNEPLNKEALERMKKIYNPDSLANNNEIKEKVKINPELGLIGLDPKAILAKHQNDFIQYLLRNLELDEMRAIRASLPKFRNDQKKQIEFCESLEAKIDQWVLRPPTPAPPKTATLKKFKPKPAAPAAGGGGIFAELLAKRKLLETEEGVDADPIEKAKEAKPGTIKLAPSKPIPPLQIPPLALRAPPKPPPPPLSLF